MTNRIFALSVALEENVRDDDVQQLIEAIRMMRGVLDVSANVADISQFTADKRARADLGKKIIEIVYPRD